MATERDFCTMYDKLMEHSELHELGNLLTKHCLTGLITNPVSKRTFIAPTSKAFSALTKKNKTELKKQVKMHVLGRQILPDQSFKDRTQLDVPTMEKGVKYEVSKAKSAKNIIVEGRECKLLDIAGNGALYTTDDLLPAKKTEARAKGSKKPRAKSKKQKGGSPFQMSYGSQPRFEFLENYQENYSEQWAMYALAHLLLYLNQNIGDFRNLYLPFLGTDPMSTLELLLQLRDQPQDPQRLLIGDDLFSGFFDSKYYLSKDQNLLQEGRNLLRSFCNEMDTPGMCPYETHYLQESFIKQHQDYVKTLLTTSPLEARNKIVSIYQNLGDIDRYSPGQVALFRKIWEKPGEGLLRNDLLRFFSKQTSNLPWDVYNQSMDTLFGRPINETLNIILQPSSLSGNLGSATDYRFPTDMLVDWVNSECFLHCFPVDMYRGEHSGYTPFTLASDDIPFSSLTRTTIGSPSYQYTSVSGRMSPQGMRPSLSASALDF